MIELSEQPIDKGRILAAVESDSAGAVATFDGRVRNHSGGKAVTHLYYEAHAPVVLRELEAIRKEAMKRWDVDAVAVVHRVGRLEVGESSVFIAVSAAHRGPAFEACRFVIDTLKQRVPVWKKECFTDGEVWVEPPPDPMPR
jgi:molybdopterin synthase catalytic subunit